MKERVHFALLMLILLSLAGCSSQSPQVSEGSRVLIIIRSYSSYDMSYMTDNELGVMIDMLEDEGFEIRIASLAHDPYESETRTITPDLLVSDVDSSAFDAVVIPCLSTGLNPDTQEIAELVMEFYNQDIVIAAQHGARATLNEAEIITDEQMESSGVIQVGSVITSACCPDAARYYGCEDDTRGLIESLITTLNDGV